MSFYKKYELDRLMADGDAKTFRAVENATGRVVFLHLFNPSGQPLLAALKSKLGGVQGKPVAPLIEIGEFAGAQYAVTQAIEPFGNLRDWMAQHVAASNPLLDDSDPALAAPTDVPLAKPLRQRPSAPPSSAPPPFAPPPFAPPPFAPLVADHALPARAPAGPPPSAVAPPLPASESLGGLLADGPGEFTRLYRDLPVAPAQPASPSPAGEFTRLFQEPPVAPATPPGGRAFREPPSPQADAPGEFTRLFDPPAPSAHMPQGGLVADAPGEFTSLFQPPPTPAPLPVPPAGRALRTPPAAPAPPPGAAPPGEFTSLFQQAPEAPAPLPSAQAGRALPTPPAMPAPTSAKAPPSEFSGMFQPPPTPAPLPVPPAGRALRTPPEAPAPPPGAAPNSLGADAPGDFTSLFRPPAAAPAPPPAAPAPPRPPAAEADERESAWPRPAPDADDAETGQFTRLFGSPMSGEAIDIEKEHLSAARSAPPENRPFQQAGEFTRMFGPHAGAPGAAAHPQGDATQALNTTLRLPSASGMFGTPKEMADAAAAALAGGKPADSGPGEYTRLFDPPKKPAEPTQPAVAKATPPEAVPAKKSNRDWIVIVVSVLVLVSLIVVAIVLRRR